MCHRCTQLVCVHDARLWQIVRSWAHHGFCSTCVLLQLEVIKCPTKDYDLAWYGGTLTHTGTDVQTGVRSRPTSKDTHVSHLRVGGWLLMREGSCGISQNLGNFPHASTGGWVDTQHLFCLLVFRASSLLVLAMAQVFCCFHQFFPPVHPQINAGAVWICPFVYVTVSRQWPM